MADDPRVKGAALAVERAHTCTDELLVEEALTHIRGLWTQALLSTVVALGEYIIEKFYAGNLAEARSQRPNKPVALARLLERADELPVSAHALKQAVRISVQYRELPRGLAEKLSKTQHEALLPIGDAETKVRLAEEAVQNQLSGRQLLEKVSAVRRPHPGGRPPLPPVLRRVGAVLRVLDAPDLDDALHPSALQALSPAHMERLHQHVRRAQQLLGRVGAALQQTAAARR